MKIDRWDGRGCPTSSRIRCTICEVIALLGLESIFRRFRRRCVLYNTCLAGGMGWLVGGDPGSHQGVAFFFFFFCQAAYADFVIQYTNQAVRQDRHIPGAFFFFLLSFFPLPFPFFYSLSSGPREEENGKGKGVCRLRCGVLEVWISRSRNISQSAPS